MLLCAQTALSNMATLMSPDSYLSMGSNLSTLCDLRVSPKHPSVKAQ